MRRAALIVTLLAAASCDGGTGPERPDLLSFAQLAGEWEITGYRVGPIPCEEDLCLVVGDGRTYDRLEERFTGTIIIAPQVDTVGIQNGGAFVNGRMEAVAVAVDSAWYLEMDGTDRAYRSAVAYDSAAHLSVTSSINEEGERTLTASLFLPGIGGEPTTGIRVSAPIGAEVQALPAGWVWRRMP